MRTLMVAAIGALLAGSAYAQMPPVGIPLGEDKPSKPVDPVKENEYRSTLGGLPNQKPGDPWGSIRSTPPPPAAATKKPAPPKNGTVAKNAPTSKDAPGKDASPGKNGSKNAPKNASAPKPATPPKDGSAPKNAAADKKTN